jgi:hypothetical protein
MHIFSGDFNFKGLTARRLYKSFGVKGLIEGELCLEYDIVNIVRCVVEGSSVSEVSGCGSGALK